MREIRISGLVVLLAGTVMAAACSDGALRSPVGPSSLTAAADATASAPVVDRSAVVSAGATTEWAANSGWSTAADGLMVQASEVITAVSGTCPDRVMTMRGVPVTINSGTMFGPGARCSGLAVGLTVHIAGLLTSSNGAYSVIATSISVDQPTEDGGDGTVGNLMGTCPAVSMVVRGARVHTDAETTFVGGACGNLRNGTKVEVEGTTNPDGSLDATRVTFVDQPGGGGQGRTAGEGTVASLRGTCPTLTMVIRGYAVTTSNGTIYVGGSCASLRPGAKVIVTGVNQGNSLMAETIEFKD